MRSVALVLALAGLVSACSLIAPSDAELSAGLHDAGGGDAARVREAGDRDRGAEDAAGDARHDGAGSPDAAGHAEGGGGEAGDGGGPVTCVGEGAACSPGECCAGAVCFFGACATCVEPGEECSTAPCCSGMCRYHDHQRRCE
jgi:hypothetical protein